VAKNIEEGKVGGLFNIKSKRLKYKGSLLKKPIKNPVAFGMDVIHGYKLSHPRSFFYLGYEID
jgi:beta-glucosidase